MEKDILLDTVLRPVKTTKMDKINNFSKKVNKLLVKFFAVFAISATSVVSLNMVEANAKMNGVDPNLFYKNALNMPLTLQVGRDAIQVAINKGFSDEQKQYIKEAIEELDVDLTGIRYKILLDEKGPEDKCINISNVTNSDDYCLAEAKSNCSIYDHHLYYPISITLQTDKIENDSAVALYGIEDIYKRVIKHEMLHTLGLQDTYDYNLKDETIMYGYLKSGIAMDLTDKDKEVLNTVYSADLGDKIIDINVFTKTPKLAVVTDKKNIVEDEMSF